MTKTKQNLALFDLDNTLLAGDSDYNWSLFLISEGLLDAKTHHDRNEQFYADYKAGCLNITEFLQFQLQPLSQHPKAFLDQLHKKYMQKIIRPMMTAKAQALVDKHKAAGDLCVVITATNSTVDGQTGLGYGRREDDLAAIAFPDRSALLSRVETSVEAVDVRSNPGQPLRRAFDLSDTGEEGEDVSLRLIAQRAADRGGHLILNPRFSFAANVAESERVGPAFAFDHRRISHERGKTTTVERCRHRNQAQVRPQTTLCVKRERQAEITVEAPFMNLIKQNGGNPGKVGVSLNPVAEDAFGEDKDARRSRLLAVHPRRIANGPPHRLPRQFRHAFSRCARGKAAGGEEQDLPFAPRLFQQRGGDSGGLASSGRGDEDGVGCSSERGQQFRQNCINR